jgi:hypothetical protein
VGGYRRIQGLSLDNDGFLQDIVLYQSLLVSVSLPHQGQGKFVHVVVAKLRVAGDHGAALVPRCDEDGKNGLGSTGRTS